MGLPIPDTIPEVTVFWNSPKVLPIARTLSPTFTEAESASLAGGIFFGILSTCRKAISLVLSLPTTFACCSSESWVTIVTDSLTFSTTCLLVRIRPSELIKTPVPAAPLPSSWIELIDTTLLPTSPAILLKTSPSDEMISLWFWKLSTEVRLFKINQLAISELKEKKMAKDWAS